MAQGIHFYEPVISSWPDPYFVTLTRQTVPACELDITYGHSLATFNQVKHAMRNSRTDPVRLKALRKTECTYNVATGLYHLHYHAVTSTAGEAERLIDGWTLRFPKDLVNRAAQDMRPCDERGLVEVLKYGTKLVTKGKDGYGRYVPAFALDTVFQVMRGKRLVQPIGFKVPKEIANLEDDFDTSGGIPALTRLGECVLWEWENELHDWVDNQTGEVLSGYVPSESDLRLIQNGLQ